MKFRVFWDVAPCSQVDIDRRFRVAYFLYHQGHLGNLRQPQRDNTALHPRRLNFTECNTFVIALTCCFTSLLQNMKLLRWLKRTLCKQELAGVPLMVSTEFPARCFVSWGFLISWWGETTSLNCCHWQTYCSYPRWYMSMENDGGMILTGKTRRNLS
jgi:hypothetical protein